MRAEEPVCSGTTDSSRSLPRAGRRARNDNHWPSAEHLKLGRHTWGRFETEPRPTRSHLMGVGLCLRVQRWLRRPGKGVRPGRSRIGRGLSGLAGNSADYETNPIVRQASREAVLPPNFHELAFPPNGKAGAGAGFQGDSESSRKGDHSAGGGVEE